MLRVFSVNYDLNAKAKPDYLGLYEEIRNSPNWWHFLESTWLVATNESANELWVRLSTHLHENDWVLIIEVRDNVSGWLPKKAWEWINDNVPMPATA